MLLILGAKQPEQDRQPDLATTEAWNLNDEHDNNPAVPPASPLSGAFRLRAVVEVVRANTRRPDGRTACHRPRTAAGRPP